MSISSYLKETKAELKEVRFPTISQTVTFTVLVVVLSAIIALVLGGADFGLKTILAKILNK